MNSPMPVWNRSFRRATDVVRDFSHTEPGVVFLRPPAVAIGSRWKPTHAVVRDPDSGIYFERNPRMETSTELAVQRALLSRPAANRLRYWLIAIALPIVAVFGCKAFL